VDDQICVDRFLPALRLQLQAVTAAALLEPGHFRVAAELDAKAPRVVYEPRDEVLVEMLERLASADDGRLSAGPSGYMCELERDVSCTKERNPRR